MGEHEAEIDGARDAGARATASSAIPPTITASSRTSCACATSSPAASSARSIAAACSTATARRGSCANSAWRDQGAGVLPDLGSHLLDTARFWFGDIGDEFRFVSADGFENRAPGSRRASRRRSARPRLELEMTLLMLAQPLHLRRVRRERLGAYPLAVQMGAVAVHPTHARAAERASAGGDARPWCRTIRPGRSNTRISRASAERRAQTDLANDIWLNRVLRRLAPRRQPKRCAMTPPVVGFAGMTHLGLVSAAAVAGRAFDVVVLRCRCRRLSRRLARRRSAGARAGLDELIAATPGDNVSPTRRAISAAATSSMSRWTCRPTTKARATSPD